MESKIADAIGFKYHPVAILLADEKPADALQFKKGKWSCVMFLFANAAKGKTAAFDAETCGCWGGAVGLGFGNAYAGFPGGVDCFTRFLSSGNAQSEQGQQVAQALASTAGKEMTREFLEGEGYVKTPELVRQWLEEIPITDIESSYVLFKPLCDVNPETEKPETVVFLADPDQLSALVILANYGRPGAQNVIMPWAAGCQNIGILPYHEAGSDRPRAVVGLTDISARKFLRAQIGGEFLTFATPWQLFLEMEGNVAGSFLEKHVWQSLRQ